MDKEKWILEMAREFYLQIIARELHDGRVHYSPATHEKFWRDAITQARISEEAYQKIPPLNVAESLL